MNKNKYNGPLKWLMTAVVTVVMFLPVNMANALDCESLYQWQTLSSATTLKR